MRTSTLISFYSCVTMKKFFMSNLTFRDVCDIGSEPFKVLFHCKVLQKIALYYYERQINKKYHLLRLKN